MATKQAKTENAEYNDPGTDGTPVLTGNDAANAGRNKGAKAGDLADKAYYVDEDGKVSASEPERGTVLVAEGDVISEAVAERLSKK